MRRTQAVRCHKKSAYGTGVQFASTLIYTPGYIYTLIYSYLALLFAPENHHA